MNRYEDEETIIRWLKIEGAVFKDAATIKEFSVAALEKLAKDKDANTRLAVAANPRTPVSSLTILAGDKDDDVRAGVASNTNTPTELLELLAKDSDEVVRWAVAGNTSTPSDTVNLLSQDEDGVVSRTVLNNRNTPEAILDILGEEDQDDEEEIDLYEILDKKACTWISRKFITYSEDEFLRAKAVQNSDEKISPRTLKVLSEDEFAIEIDPDHGTGVVYDGVRVAVARHLNTPIEILEALSEDEEPRVVNAVAGNPHTPVHVLERIAQEEVDLENGNEIWEGSIWITLAGNENLPAYLVEQFVVEYNPYLRRVAFDHPKATLESKALASLLGFPKSWNAEYEAMWGEIFWGDKWRTWDESALEKEMVTAMSTLTKHRLVELASDSNVNVRLAVAYHPFAPINILASDSDELVRYVISKNCFMTPEAKSASTLMGSVLGDDEVDELMQIIEGRTELWMEGGDWFHKGLLEREETRARVVMSSLENWEISPDAKKNLEKWAETFAKRASDRMVNE